MRFRFIAVSAILVFSFAAAASGQPQADPHSATTSAAPSASALLQPALADVQSTTAALRISKWKASGGVRKASQEDVDSIQRDLGSTLPGLMARADAAPGSVPTSFAVYRNLDALYDVLLRVSQTADLAASSREAAAVAASLHRLEMARSALGDAILNTAQRHETRIVALEAAVRTARSAPAARKKETVIEDGPVKSHTRKTRRRTTHKKPAPKS